MSNNNKSTNKNMCIAFDGQPLSSLLLSKLKKTKKELDDTVSLGRGLSPEQIQKAKKVSKK